MMHLTGLKQLPPPSPEDLAGSTLALPAQAPCSSGAAESFDL